MMKIILASQSPRRRELLERMGIRKFEICPARGEEVAEPGMAPDRLVNALSRQKAAEVALQAEWEDLIIAADTVVAIDGMILGKPTDERAAEEMLRRLSGRSHQVYTGLTLRRGSDIRTQHEQTEVRFRPLSWEEIRAYVATGEPMDKAGAYGIQGYGAMLVEGISGDFYNVMGLPVCRLRRMLKEFGVDPLVDRGGVGD